MMTTTMKLFATRSVVIVPPEWMRAMGHPAHHCQVDIAATARVKADVERMLTEAGVFPGASREMRLVHDASAPVQALVRSGLVDFTRPGLLAWRGPVRDQAIIQVDGDRLEVVGRWARDPALPFPGLTVVRVEQVPADGARGAR